MHVLVLLLINAAIACLAFEDRPIFMGCWGGGPLGLGHAPGNSAWQKAAAEKSRVLVSDLDGLIKIKEKVNVTQ